ncbi:hypothetical protein BX600DRAFT_462424 [Xylariales sp. PMI_506]|nr:hypothetical protein BX600DRAFT_462424 [Xylariales sp. PMI_506]
MRFTNRLVFFGVIVRLCNSRSSSHHLVDLYSGGVIARHIISTHPAVLHGLTEPLVLICPAYSPIFLEIPFPLSCYRHRLHGICCNYP